MIILYITYSFSISYTMCFCFLFTEICLQRNMQSISGCLLSTYYMQGTVLGNVYQILPSTAFCISNRRGGYLSGHHTSEDFLHNYECGECHEGGVPNALRVCGREVWSSWDQWELHKEVMIPLKHEWELAIRKEERKKTISYECAEKGRNTGHWRTAREWVPLKQEEGREAW